MTILDTLNSAPISGVSTEVGKEAEDTVLSIRSALNAAFPRTKQNRRSSAWWNDSCRLALRRYHEARRWGPSNTEKFALRAAVRHAKKRYLKSKITRAENLPEVYKIIKCHNNGPKYEPPLTRC